MAPQVVPGEVLDTRPAHNDAAPVVGGADVIPFPSPWARPNHADRRDEHADEHDSQAPGRSRDDKLDDPWGDAR